MLAKLLETKVRGKMPNRAMTIRDVANEAGVSATTVSHVFSGRRPVAPRTQERVLAAATRLGYIPDANARMLATGRSSAVALDLELELVGDGILLNPYFSAVISSLSEAAVTYGFTFRLLPADVRTASTIRHPSIAGAIAVDPTSGNQWIPRLVDNGVRVVCIGRYPGPKKTSWVDNDHRKGISDAIDHLAQQGYERVALISANQRSSLMIDLEAGFRDAIADTQLSGKIVHVGDLTETTARELSRRLLSSKSKPDAVVAAIDRIAVGVVRAAVDVGIRVPMELGVVGLGDTPLAERLQPGLTSIRSTPKQLADEAMQLIWAHWLNPSAPDKEILLPADLVIRGSTMRRRPHDSAKPASART
jgi:DNA-binding LacI/PurR family transcriptional regulator